MIVSWNWLTEYLRLDMPVESLTERLALAGLNHESTDDVGGDLAIDLEVTSNRPDCLGHLGVAREIGVLFERPVSFPTPNPPASGPLVETLTGVTVESPDLCPRFTARVIQGVKVGPSPYWLRKRLETLGVRPISNVVDVTNYVMFECGQPLHAYDLAKLDGHRLIVRKAVKGEKLVAINNKTYDLTPGMLVIADASRPVGLAGVMGGAETEVADATTDVLIEAAQFEAMSIRRTSRALGLFSPASYRFERPLDPEATEWASRRCAELILKTAGGTLRPGLIDVGMGRPSRAPVVLRIGQIARVLGITIDRDAVLRILTALGLTHSGGSPEAPAFVPPSWRSDLEREIDLIEEVARVHGYEHIPETRAVPLTSAPRSTRERVEADVRNTLIGLGLDEAVTYSLVSDELAAPLAPEDADGTPIRVDHSSRKRENNLRRSLVPSLLSVRQHNEARGTADAELFEIANVYLPRAGRSLPEEPTRLGLVSGRDFLGLKGIIEALLDRFHALGELAVKPVDVPMFKPGRSAELSLNGRRLGFLGEVDPSVLKTLELRDPCSAAELAFDVLQDRADLVPRYKPLPSYPVVARDLSLVVPQSLAWSDLAGVVGRSGGPTLEAIVYLDTFKGGNLPEGQQSLHFGLRFRHPDRTLTGDEVEDAVKAIVASCSSQFEATLRT
jgi:phenylalanyl-tRNA synthetase beta chain